MKAVTEKEAKKILQELEKHPKYMFWEKTTGRFKGNLVTYLHVYIEDATTANPYNLDTFSNVVGRGYLIEIKEPIKRKGMKKGLGAKASKTTTKRKPAKSKPTLKKVCRKVVKQEGVKGDGTLKKGYRYKKGGGVVKAAPAKKKTTTAKKATTRRKPAVKKK